jgi:E3 ubiquitin-protein ligase UBR2
MDNTTVGAATAHAASCGAGTGIFLRLVSSVTVRTFSKSFVHRVLKCQILLLSGRTKGCFYAPPYLDDYGETDQGLKYVPHFI